MSHTGEASSKATTGELLSRPFTLARFRILPPLYELHRQTVAVPSDIGLSLLHVEIVESFVPSSVEPTGGKPSLIFGDEIGVAHNSMVEVAMPGSLSMQPAKEVEPSDVPEGQLYALRALNHVIQHYRVQVGAPQIRPVPVKEGRGFRFTHFQQDGTANSGVVVGRNALPLDGDAADVPVPNAQIVQAIKIASEAGPAPLWATLKSDAFADLDSGDVHSGLAHLQMAFEALVHQASQRTGISSAATQIGNSHVLDQALSCHGIFSGSLSRKRVEELVEGLYRHRSGVLIDSSRSIPARAMDEALACYLELQDWLVGLLAHED